MSRPLHVLHLIDGLGLGGAERMLVDLANQTVSDGKRVSVCVTRDDLTLAPALDKRIRLHLLHRRARVSPLALLHFARIVRRENVDVVHVHMRSNILFAAQARLARLVRVPLVFHDHYGTIETDMSVPRWFPVVKRYIAVYVGVYEKLSEWARRAGMPASRVVTIPNALDIERLSSGEKTKIRDELKISAAKPLGLMVATLRRDKGIEVLLAAVARAKNRDGMHIVVAGADGEPAYAAKCRALLAELGLQDSVTFLGPRTDVPDLLASVDFAILSSHTESGPLVLIEYLAAALPFVSTLVGDVGRRLAGFGVEAFTPPGDAAELSAQLDSLVALSSSERTKRGEQGRSVLHAHWDIKKVMPAWYDVYLAAIRGAA